MRCLWICCGAKSRLTNRVATVYDGLPDVGYQQCMRITPVTIWFNRFGSRICIRTSGVQVICRILKEVESEPKQLDMRRILQPTEPLGTVVNRKVPQVCRTMQTGLSSEDALCAGSTRCAANRRAAMVL